MTNPQDSKCFKRYDAKCEKNDEENSKKSNAKDKQSNPKYTKSLIERALRATAPLPHEIQQQFLRQLEEAKQPADVLKRLLDDVEAEHDEWLNHLTDDSFMTNGFKLGYLDALEHVQTMIEEAIQEVEA